KIKGGVIVSSAGECPVVSSGNSQTANVVSSTSTSTQTDTIPPVITLLGNNPAEIEKGTMFVDPGANVSDDITQGIIPDIIENTVDTSILGEYRVVWSAHDAALNYATTTRTVIVVDPYATSTTSTTTSATTTTSTTTPTN
ncbi:MAG: immunoglobulin-like domain-containing protein, partial [Patescibacteria group bacterium]